MRTLTQQEFSAYLGTLPYPPNRFQQKILEDVAFTGTSKNAQHLVIKALAGSGKTTLLVMLAELLQLMGDDGERDLFLAFNVKIADELNKRLPDGFSAINSHKVGNRAIKGRTRMNKYKMRDLCQPLVEARFSENDYTRSQRYVLTRTLEDLISKTMLNLLDPTDATAIMGMADHHGMFEDEVFGEDEIAVMLNLLPQAMAEANKVYEQSKEISFDEMLYIPVKGGMIPRRFDRAFVDECQDLNKAQQEIVFMSVRDGGRMIFVGDPNQAIYGFSGADAFSFENLIERSEAMVLELNICYRCPSSHLDLARAIVPEIEARPGAPEGKIEYIPDEALPKHTTPGSLVMCRLTAPLIQAYFDHVKARKKAQVLGRDIGFRPYQDDGKGRKSTWFRLPPCR
jgi:DNA helicase-2/ATP-dependent DNA helicase PcrA